MIRGETTCAFVECFSVTHLSPGDIHEHGEAGHVVALTADVGAVPENHLAALRRPAAVPTADIKHKEDSVRITSSSV